MENPRWDMDPYNIIEEPSTIGEGTRIWYFSHVMPGAVIGMNCLLGQNVFVDRGVIIGDRVKLQNNVSIYENVTLEDDVFCGPSCVFTNVSRPRAHISQRGNFARTLVKKGATIGANATIVCGVEIGEYAFIGAGSVVTRDVPAHALVYGNPARIKGWVCDCGTDMTRTQSQRHPLLPDLTDLPRVYFDCCPACGKQYRRVDDRVEAI